MKNVKKVFKMFSDLAERRIVGTLISALPGQLKSILTEVEVEQFACRIYARLVSDGIIASITIDSATQNKDSTVRRSLAKTKKLSSWK